MNKVNVRARPDGKGWLVDYRWGGHRHRETFPTAQVARDRKATVLQNIREYGHPDPTGTDGDSITVEDAVRQYLAAIQDRGLAAKTLSSYRGHAEALIRHWGGRRISDLTREEIEDWITSHREGGYSLVYARNMLAQLHGACKELMLEDPTRYVRWPREKAPEVKFYTVDQSKAILDAATARFRGVVAVHLFTGIRPSEAASLRPEDIHPDEKYIVVRGKMGRRVVEGMPDTVWAWLEKHPYDATNYVRNIAGLRVSIGFPWIQDGLRHTFCTYMFAMTDAGKTAKCSGHRNPYTLHNHYLGVARKADAEKFFNLRPAPDTGSRPG